uniref:Uncharacterized protein n=1 Tax=Ditylenchus dipsaci TaxID=166011 RepID=A0A915D2F7_9BILA
MSKTSFPLVLYLSLHNFSIEIASRETEVAILAATVAVHRRFFHVTVSLMAVSGLLYDPHRLAVCANVLLHISNLLELLRCFQTWTFERMLDLWLLIFPSEQVLLHSSLSVHFCQMPEDPRKECLKKQ